MKTSNPENDHPFSENIKLLKIKVIKPYLSIIKLRTICFTFLYEGFGIPILEASYHNKLILLSSIPVFGK